MTSKKVELVPLFEILLNNSLAQSEKEARSLVMRKRVVHGDKVLDKASMRYPKDIDIRLKGGGKDHNWVSRGGIKLSHALEKFAVDIYGKIAIDVGCSTGGFTDVLLVNGIQKVYAVDVAYGELAWKIRNDPKVVVLERVNARYLSDKHVPEEVDLIVCDASFISLKKVLPKALNFAAEEAMLIALIKPQFEVKKHEVGDKGIVEDPLLHDRVCQEVSQWVSSLNGWKVEAITKSPIKGMEGNTEFLIFASKRAIGVK